MVGILAADDDAGGSGTQQQDSISFDPGQPTPNPGGQAAKISASGSYITLPGHSQQGVSFTADQQGIFQTWAATAANGQWNRSPVGIPAGTYDCQAEMNVDDGQKLWVVKSSVVSGVVVK
jgi:hypothetical protein